MTTPWRCPTCANRRDWADALYPKGCPTCASHNAAVEREVAAAVGERDKALLGLRESRERMDRAEGDVLKLTGEVARLTAERDTARKDHQTALEDRDLFAAESAGLRDALVKVGEAAGDVIDGWRSRRSTGSGPRHAHGERHIERRHDALD